MKNIYVVRKESEKKKGVIYNQMYIDLGYQQVPISFDMGLIAQLLNMTHEQVANLKINEPKLVATFQVIKEGK